MFRVLASFYFLWCGLAFAATPGLDTRAPVGAYMNGALPTLTAEAMPALLSSTGVFTDMAARTPHPGLVPYALNSPLWTDGALKSRFIALPFDGTVGSPNSPPIGFSPTGAWTFPNGTVIVKNFDMLVDERAGAPKPVRRLETRILVRNADGTIRGATYKWNTLETEATRVDIALTEAIRVIQINGDPRDQNYLYPDPNQCVRCHNPGAGMVLGPNTAQLNGDFQYVQPNLTLRTDNQLHTFNHLAMLDTELGDTATYPQYAKMAAVTDPSATLEHRVRSYLSSNCGHCHRGPGNGEGPLFDARFETPILSQNIVSSAGFGGLIRKNLPGSRIYVRDASIVSPMPPVARNVPDATLLATYDTYVNYPYDIVSVSAPGRNTVRVQFDRPVDPASASEAGNYTINNGATVLQATLDTNSGAVLLTTSSLASSVNYSLTVNRVKEAAAPQNPIWPNTVAAFFGPPATIPGAPSITITSAGNGQATLSFTAPVSDGGSAITSYTAICTSGNPNPNVASNTGGLSIVVTGLTNGVGYDCSVYATNAAGSGPNSASVRVTPIAPPKPTLVSAASQKLHGPAGVFELPIDLAPINGAVTVESRTIGNGHTIVFRFDIPISSAGSVTIQQSSPAGGATATAVANGNAIAVTLTNLPDNQRVSITLTGLNGLQNETASASIGFLVGDVNNTRSVNSSDISGVKARAGQTTSSSNFKFDLNASGGINSADISAVKARAGLLLP